MDIECGWEKLASWLHMSTTPGAASVCACLANVSRSSVGLAVALTSASRASSDTPLIAGEGRSSGFAGGVGFLFPASESALLSS